jgi:uncharacterized protein YabN with tetrapyrrole methylase and pyrophosphatase domain
MRKKFKKKNVIKTPLFSLPAPIKPMTENNKTSLYIGCITKHKYLYETICIQSKK